MRPDHRKLISVSAFFAVTTLGTFVWPDEWLYPTRGHAIAFIFSGGAWFYVVATLFLPPLVFLSAAYRKPPLSNFSASLLRGAFTLALTAAGVGIPLIGLIFGFFFPDQKALVTTFQAMGLLLQLLFYKQAFKYIRDPERVLWTRRMWLYAAPVLVFAHWSIGSGIAAGCRQLSGGRRPLLHCR